MCELLKRLKCYNTQELDALLGILFKAKDEMMPLTVVFCNIWNFTNIDQLCLTFPLYRDALVTPQSVGQN